MKNKKCLEAWLKGEDVWAYCCDEWIKVLSLKEAKVCPPALNGYSELTLEDPNGDYVYIVSNASGEIQCVFSEEPKALRYIEYDRVQNLSFEKELVK